MSPVENKSSLLSQGLINTVAARNVSFDGGMRLENKLLPFLSDKSSQFLRNNMIG